MCGDELGGAPAQWRQDAAGHPAGGHGVLLPRHLLRGEHSQGIISSGSQAQLVPPQTVLEVDLSLYKATDF